MGLQKRGFTYTQSPKSRIFGYQKPDFPDIFCPLCSFSAAFLEARDHDKRCSFFPLDLAKPQSQRYSRSVLPLGSHCHFSQKVHFQFAAFLLQLLFLATGPASSVTPLTRATKRKKKPRQGHNELKTRFSNGPTKTEPPGPSFFHLARYRRLRRCHHSSRWR